MQSMKGRHHVHMCKVNAENSHENVLKKASTQSNTFGGVCMSTGRMPIITRVS